MKGSYILEGKDQQSHCEMGKGDEHTVHTKGNPKDSTTEETMLKFIPQREMQIQ